MTKNLTFKIIKALEEHDEETLVEVSKLLGIPYKEDNQEDGE
jgi:hypothetical protein